MNKFKQSAVEILSKAKKPLHYSEITRLALESGILETEGATPESSMNAQISMDIKTKGLGSEFVRTATGIYSINANKKAIKTTQRVLEVEKEEEEKIVTESSFTGKAGEHLVCSELLFRNFNASIMSVDVGIDISAIKDNKFFGIQVKTANTNKFNTYNFHIRRVSFERHNHGNIFYVFVLRVSDKTRFLILPTIELERKIKEGAIFAVNKRSGFAVNIKFRNDKVYLGNINHEMDYFLDNWELIK